MLRTLLFPISLALFLIALTLILLLVNEWRAQRQRQIKAHFEALDLPEGKLVYEDADGLNEPLISQQFPLTGKPDYILQLPDGRPFPIELKLDVYNAQAPYNSHVIQLAADCLVLEDYFVQPPTHGLLRYADRDFTIEYTTALRKKIIRLLDEMHSLNETERPFLTKQRANKCRACTFQPICPIGHDK